MRHLAIFVHDFSATGVVRNALAIAAHMAATDKWRVSLLCARAQGVLLNTALASNAEIVPLMSGDIPERKRPAELASCVPTLRQWLKKLRPDCLLSAGNHAHLPIWAATRGLDRPLRVYRISNDLDHKGAHSLKARLRRVIQRLLIRDAQCLVLVSPRLAENTLFTKALAQRRAVIIRNGADVTKARTLCAEPLAHAAMMSNEPIVLAVGRMVKQKNFETLIDAVAQARHERPMRLVILGDGCNAARESLRARAETRGLGTDLIFAGTSDNPFAFMARANVVALASWWEGSPNVLLEAMACGTPVVASHTAGNAAEILDNGRHGLLVDPADPAAIAKALLQQIDPARRTLPADRAECFALPKTLAAYNDLFDTLPIAHVSGS